MERNRRRSPNSNLIAILCPVRTWARVVQQILIANPDPETNLTVVPKGEKCWLEVTTDLIVSRSSVACRFAQGAERSVWTQKILEPGQSG